MDTDDTYTEIYLSENDFEQVYSACTYALNELNMYIRDEGINMFGNYFIEAKAKFNLFNQTNLVDQFTVQLRRKNEGTKLTLFIDYGWALGPWVKNNAINLGKTFIRNVKLAENLFPSTVKPHSTSKGDELEIKKNESEEFTEEEVAIIAEDLDQFNIADKEWIGFSNIKLEPKEIETEDSIRVYLQEKKIILYVPEEIDLILIVASQINREVLATQFESDKGHYPSDEEWAELMDMPLTKFKKILNFGRRAKEKLVQSNLNLVVTIAKEYMNRGLSFQDLIRRGTLGILMAAKKIDHEKGYKFSTYATWWIRRSIAIAIGLNSTSDFIPDDHNEDDSSTPNLVKSDSKADQLISEADALKKYAELKDQGIITEEEFSAKKKQILGL